MPPLGAHMSIAGGYEKAIEAAEAAGCDCVQLFTKNNNQWRAKPISPEEIERFSETLVRLRIESPISHASYLINLASPDAELWKKSVEALIVELERAALLGIPYVVVHPGSHMTSTPEQGCRRIARAINEIHRRRAKLPAQLLLENTAGQGTNLGWRYEQLAAILDKVKQPQRIGVCLDTCHAFAAGYDLRARGDYLASMRELHKQVGIERVKAVHLNDSKRELGSRIDRHEQIGAGELGLEPFAHLLNDKRFRRVPMYLETPKGEHQGEDWDRINLRVLRGLLK